MPVAPAAMLVGVVAIAAGAGFIGGVLGEPDGRTTTVISAGGASVATGAEQSLQDAIASVEPSIVVVRDGASQGSGVVTSPRGLVVTNEHVITGRTEVTLTTADGRSIRGDVLRADKDQDLAVIRPRGAVGRGAILADEPDANLRLGDTVFAVGSPFGLRNSVTTGVVSAVNRMGNRGQRMLQTDAAINPGNSGGGLFDLRGRLVGIPTSIESPVRGNVGIGFAVPVARVADLLAQIP
ncbi:MAG: trypsin-like peptidase domain-containing protein [Actinobacteria bacterium]|nr:trypsin-like peptidase domain-containing protein [Actinomycetota bacterium]